MCVPELTGRRPFADRDRQALRAMARRILRLDESFSEFHEHCRRVDRLRWVAAQGAGRMLRSAGLFEDLVKILCTTNCSWAATEGMVRRLVEEFGRRAPSGRRAFPTPAALAEVDPDHLRDRARCGYRAEAVVALARGFHREGLEARLTTDGGGDDAAVREAFLELRGFGPYAAGHALRLTGHYGDLALDSMCRAWMAENVGDGKPVSDRAIARRYEPFGSWAGLALWMDLTTQRLEHHCDENDDS